MNQLIKRKVFDPPGELGEGGRAVIVLGKGSERTFCLVTGPSDSEGHVRMHQETLSISGETDLQFIVERLIAEQASNIPRSRVRFVNGPDQTQLLEVQLGEPLCIQEISGRSSWTDQVVLGIYTFGV